MSQASLATSGLRLAWKFALRPCMGWAENLGRRFRLPTGLVLSSMLGLALALVTTFILFRYPGKSYMSFVLVYVLAFPAFHYWLHRTHRARPDVAKPIATAVAAGSSLMGAFIAWQVASRVTLLALLTLAALNGVAVLRRKTLGEIVTARLPAFGPERGTPYRRSTMRWAALALSWLFLGFVARFDWFRPGLGAFLIVTGLLAIAMSPLAAALLHRFPKGLPVESLEGPPPFAIPARALGRGAPRVLGFTMTDDGVAWISSEGGFQTLPWERIDRVHVSSTRIQRWLRSSLVTIQAGDAWFQFRVLDGSAMAQLPQPVAGHGKVMVRRGPA